MAEYSYLEVYANTICEVLMLFEASVLITLVYLKPLSDTSHLYNK